MRGPWSRASLTLHSSTHPASEVDDVLGLTATRMHEKGDRKRNRKTGEEHAPQKLSAWIFEPVMPPVTPDDGPFTALRVLLEQVGDRGDALAALRPRYSTAIYWSGVVSGQGGFTMEADLIAGLARLGCDLHGAAYSEDLEDE